MEQIPFDIDNQIHDTFTNYITGSNQELIAAVQSCSKGEGESFLYLWGGKCVGKTHILQAACHQAGGMQRTAAFIPLRQHMQESPKILHQLESVELICIDDIEAIAGMRTWETALFHLFNRIHDQQANLIITAQLAPVNITLTLPDLRSRLSSGITYQILPINDDEKREALQLRAHQQSFQLPTRTIDFLLAHQPRNMCFLVALLDELRHASLIQKKKLTVPFVKSILAGKPIS